MVIYAHPSFVAEFDGVKRADGKITAGVTPAQRRYRMIIYGAAE